MNKRAVEARFRLLTNLSVFTWGSSFWATEGRDLVHILRCNRQQALHLGFHQPAEPRITVSVMLFLKYPTHCHSLRQDLSNDVVKNLLEDIAVVKATETVLAEGGGIRNLLGQSHAQEPAIGIITCTD